MSDDESGIPGLHSNQEWWLGNGRGGWASGTVAGAHSRKYHGLLVAAHPHPARRFLLLSKLEETLVLAGRRVELSSNHYPGVVHPQGWKAMARFLFDGAVARWTFSAAERRLSKEVWCAPGSNRTYIRYTLLEGERTGLEVVPLVSGRAVDGLGLPDELCRGPEAEAGEREVSFNQPVPWRMEADRGIFRPQPDVYRNLRYPLEEERGEGAQEDLYTPGRFEVALGEGQHITFRAGLEGEEGADGMEAGATPESASARLERIVERHRLHNRLAPDPGLEGLVRAADAFVVRDGRGYDIVAGYPYFGAWARDAMISLPGLCIHTGRHPLAREVLHRWVGRLQDGLLPNRMDEEGKPCFESGDGALWMMWAVGQLDREGGLDMATLRRWWPALGGALRHHIAGNAQVEMADDGLLSLREERATWMDAAIDGRAVTPRAGKRVEINALWIQALSDAARWAARMGEAGSATLFDETASAARASMPKFFNMYERALDDGIEPTDDALRPNQVWALALPDVGLSPLHARTALAAVRERLFCPRAGLRTLDEADPRYHPRFGGEQRTRDEAYHQGAVWPWLIGAYTEATLRVFPQRAAELAREVEATLSHERRGALLGVPEVIDPTSLAGGGCPTQAWSVAESLRARILLARQTTRQAVRPRIFHPGNAMGARPGA